MFDLVDVSMSYGDRALFREVRWSVGDQDRVGLVGANGVGKSTLMKIIAGQITPSSGSVTTPRDATVGYLPQQVMQKEGTTVWEEVLSSRQDLLAMEHRLEEIQESLKQLEGEALEKRIATLCREQEKFQEAGGYAQESEAGKVLAGLGFPRERWHEPCRNFSGGWQLRIHLAKLLIQRPTILLLDEPTNYLDLENIEFMERTISSYPGSVVMVSHDRRFLDNVVTRITEMECETLQDYKCNYSTFLVRREKDRDLLIKKAEEQEKERERMIRFINKFRADKRRATMVQSRIKILEKMERIVVPSIRKKVRLHFPQPERSGNEVLTLKGVGKVYGDKRVFSDADLMVMRGDRVALVGLNGAGKSTLMRLLAGKEEPTEGIVKQGHGVKPLYFAQDQALHLHEDWTVLDAVQEGCDEAWRMRIRDLLGAFLFSGDDALKLCRVLSGGEKSRVGLARLLTRSGNLLLLDEPTNHLDIQTKEILLEALRPYQGTIVFVSHDRYFLEHLATKVVEIDEGELTLFQWGYKDYLWWKEEMDGEADPPVRTG